MTQSTEKPSKSYADRPWDLVRADWEAGIVTAILSERYAIPAPQIRKRASQQHWARCGTLKSVVQSKAKELVEKELQTKRVDLAEVLEDQIRECIRECVSAGRALIQRVGRSAMSADDSNLSGLAAAYRAGVEGWRISLGLNSGSESQVNIAIRVGAQPAEPVAEAEPTIEV